MPTTLGPETLVNTTTSGDQSPAGVAVLSNGTSVVAWVDEGPEAGVARLRLFDVTGAAASGEITVGPATRASVAALAGGGFVVVWATASGAPSAIHAERFDASGQPVGAVQDLATYSTAGTPLIDLRVVGLEATALPSGGFVAGWTVQTTDSLAQHGLATHTVVSDGAGHVTADLSRAIEPPQRMTVAYDPDVTYVAMPDGQHFLETWRKAQTATDFGGQMAQVHDLSGAAVGPVIPLDPGIPADGGPRLDPSSGLSAVATAGGGLAFAWSVGGRVYVSIYPADRLGLGIDTHRSQPVLAGDASTVAGSGEPHLTQLADGRLLVAWNSAGGDVMGRVFDGAGAAAGDAFVLGRVTAGVQDLADVAARADGAVAAVWRDASGLADPSGAGVKLLLLLPDGQGQVGGPGHDVLVGSPAGDVLSGGGGDDWLHGLGGADTLTGGTGADLFIFTLDGQADRATDFQPGTDYLTLFDTAGQSVDGRHGMLIWNAGRLSWDPDSDAGPAAPMAVAVMPGVSALGRGDFAANFQPSSLRLMQPDGGREEQVFDWGLQPWKDTDALFNPVGGVVRYTVHQDDGSSWTAWFDDQSTQPWSERIAEYDASGALSGYHVYADDGSHILRYFDTANAQSWSRLVDEYDGAGRLLSRTVVADDGTSWVATYDAANVQPWAAMVDFLDGDGRVVGHRTIFDDGHVG